MPQLDSSHDQMAISSGLNDLENIPTVQAQPVSVGSDAVAKPDPASLDDLPDYGGELGKSHEAVYEGDPDNVARVIKASDKLGADPAMVAGSLKEAEHAAKAPSGAMLQTIEDKYPGTTRFLKNPANMAIAKDDVANLAQSEGMFDRIKNAYQFEHNAFVGGALQEELGMLRYRQMNGETAPQTDSFRIGGFVASEMGAPMTNIEDRAQWIQNKLDELNKQRPTPETAGFLKRGLYGATEFIPQVAGGIMHGTKFGIPAALTAAAAGVFLGPADAIPATAIGSAGFTAGEAEYNYQLMAGMAYDNLQKTFKGKNVDPGLIRDVSILTGGAAAGLSLVKLDALFGAAGNKVMQALTSSVPKEVLENPATRGQAIQNFAKEYLKAGLTGTAAMTGITAANIAGERATEAISGQEISHEGEPSVGQQLWDTTKEAAATMAVMAPIGPAVNMRSEFRDARVAQLNRDFYTALGDSAEASKVKARLPQKYQEFINNVAKDGPVENVFIPQEAFRQYFQDKGVDPATVAKELGVEQSLAEALQTGGDVKVPLDVWASKVAGTEHYQGLQNDIKFSPDDFTMNEIESRKRDIEKQMQEIQAQQEGQPGSAKTSAVESAQRVYDERYQQLIDAGQSPYEARLSATLHEAAFRSLAERTGQDPYELAKRFHLEIQKRESMDQAQGKSFNQASDRDLKDAAELAATHLAPFDAKSDSPEAYGEAAEKIKKEVLDSPRRTVSLDVDEANASLNPVDNGRRPNKKNAENEVVLGKVGGKYVILDGHHRLLNAKESGYKQINATIIDLPKSHSGLTDLDGGVGKLKKSAITEIKSFEQGNNEGPKGRIMFQDNKAVIQLFKTADRSTFLHETGHYFLEIMHALSTDERAPDQIKNDMATVRDWLGLKEGEAFTTAHEQFARGFEAYLREGKAPSDVLARTFQRFKQWLVQIYRSVRSLNVEMTPEIRGVMDRLLATDEEIKNAHKEVGFNQGLPDARVRELAESAREQAESTLLRDQMRETEASNKQFLAGEETRLKAEGEEKAANLPVFKAQHDIEEALNAGKSKRGAQKSAVTAARKFLDGKLNEEDSAHIETAAEANGFESGDMLAKDIISAEANGTRQKTIDAHVAEGLRPHANMMDRLEIKRQALQAIHGDRMTEMLALERQILANKVGAEGTAKEVSKRQRIESKLAAAAAQDQAKQILDGKTIREAGSFRTYTTAERNAAIKADAAMRRKDFEAAAEYKRQQMLNHALAAEAMRNRAESEKAVSVLTKAASRQGDLKDMPYSFNRQIDQLLERFGVKERAPEDAKTLQSIATDMQSKGKTFGEIADATGMIIDKASGMWRQETLRDFIQRQNEDYHGIQIPESIISGAGVDDYKDMQMGDLRQLTAAVKTLTKLGKAHDRFLNEFIQITMNEAAERFKKQVEENVGSPYADQRKIGSKYSTPWREKVANLKNIPNGMISTLVNTLTLCTYLDGGEKNGAAHDYIYRPLKQAEDRKFARYDKMREELTGENGLFSKFYKPKELADYKKSVEKLGTQHITKENILSMALNWGNEQNRDRLRAGYGERDEMGRLVPMSDETITGLFKKHLSKKDWDFCQAVWDHLDTYWPEVAKLEMQIHGVEPERVVSAPFENEHGAYRGGYYPIAYDHEKSSEAFKNDAMKADIYKTAPASSAMTDTGHTIARVSFVARPVDLRMKVLFNHLENVIHDLEFRPAVIDVNRFMQLPDVRNTIQNAIGQHAFRGMENWLKSVAGVEQSEDLTWYEKALTWTRFGTTIATLGLTPKAFLLHAPSNVINAASEIGTGNAIKMMTRAALDVAMGRGELKDFVFEKSERMKQRLTVRDRDIMDMAKRWEGTAAGAIPHYAFMSLHLADEAVSVPLWAEIYKRNVAEFGEAKAIDIADETVTRTLGSGSKVDQIGAQRGGATKKLFTMFYSWMSVMFNRAWLGGKMAGLEYNQGNLGKAAGVMAKTAFWAFALPAIHEALLGELMYNGPTSDEDRKKRMLGKVIESPFAMVLFVRDIVPPAIHQALGEHGGDMRISPVETALQNIYKPVADGANIMFGGKKQLDEKYAEEVARGMAQVAGYPQQLNTWAFNFLDFMQNNGESSMKDFLSRRHKK